MILSSEPLSLDEALREAEGHVPFGAKRLPTIARELAPRGAIVVTTFEVEDLADFLNTAWIEIDATRSLTESLPARTLDHVAARVLEQFGSLEKLARAEPIPGRLEPSWFRSCAAIEKEGWQWERFLRPWLVPAAGAEQRGSPQPTRYVWEGNRSCLALATGLQMGWVDRRPVEVIECRLRPDD